MIRPTHNRLVQPAPGAAPRRFIQGPCSRLNTGDDKAHGNTSFQVLSSCKVEVYFIRIDLSVNTKAHLQLP